uniref:C-type lectin domain-containing protein n=1 Tax=Panagrolaimus superbus TaxID=310955 RepID=A0A914XQK8_9BILA
MITLRCHQKHDGNRVLNRDKFDSTPEWETDADKNTLEDGECPNNGVVFNPKSQKFDIKNANEQLYSLCETPRWTKLQCESEWYLIPQIRMCVKVHDENVDFIAAHTACNQEDSFIATHKDHAEVEMLRNVIVPLNLKNGMVSLIGTGGFWTRQLNHIL